MKTPSTSQAISFFSVRSSEPLSNGSTREKLTSLLALSIAEGKLLTAAKILEKDPSIITESVIASNSRRSIVRLALDSKMDSLVLFALLNGLSPDEPVFGDSLNEKVTLIEYAVHAANLNLVHYALIHGAKIEKEPAISKERSLLKGSAGLIEVASNMLANSVAEEEKAGERVDSEKTKMFFLIIQSLVEAGASTGSNRRNSLLPVLIRTSQLWSSTYFNSTSKLVSDAIKKGADINAKVNGRPLITIALGSQNIQATILLIKLGANTRTDFIGMDIIEMAANNNLLDAIPQITQAILSAGLSLARAEESAKNLNPVVKKTRGTNLDIL